MNLQVNSIMCQHNKKQSFTSFSPDISQALQDMTLFEKKTAMARLNLTDKMIQKVKNSKHELHLETIDADGDYSRFEIGNYNTNVEYNDRLSYIENVLRGIKKSYIIIKNIIDPGTKLSEAKINPLILRKQKLEQEVAKLKNNGNLPIGNIKIDSKQNDIDVLASKIVDYQSVPANNYMHDLTKREYASDCKKNYKEIDKKYRIEFSKYQTSAWRQNLDIKINNIKYWCKTNLFH